MRLFLVFAVVFLSNFLYCQENCFDKNGNTQLIELRKSYIAFSEFGQIRKSILSVILKDEVCMKEDDLMIISFKDGHQINKDNQKSFNCKGLAFYMLSTEELETIRTKELDYISIATYDSAKANIISKEQSTEIIKSINCVLNQ